MGMTVLIPLAGRRHGQRDRATSDRSAILPLAARDRRRRRPAPRADRGPAGDRRQGLGRGRVRPPRAHLRAPAALELGFFDSPADRAADVAGDGRPAVDPLLPRLRADLPDPERAHDPARERGDVRDQAVAGGAGAAAGAVRGPHRDAVQPALPAGAAGGPAADRRAHRRGRGERSPGSGSSRRSRARSTCWGASAARSPGSSTRTSTRPGCAPSTRRCSASCRSLGLAVVLLVGGRAGDQRQPVARRLHGLLHVPGDADRADADARHVAGDGAAGGRLGQPAVRDPRPRAADRRARPDAPAAARRAGRASSCATSASRYDGAASRRSRDVDLEVEAGTDRGAGRAHRLGEDQPGGAARAAL